MPDRSEQTPVVGVTNLIAGNEQWTVGAIPARIFIPGGEPQDYTFAGWVNGVFGLDFRVYDDDEGEPYMPGWSLTHIPTGFTVCAIMTGLAEAKALAEDLAELGDWNFHEPAQAKSRGKVFQAFKERHDDKVTRDTAHFAPTSLECVKATGEPV